MQYNNENEDLCEDEKCPTCQLTDQLVEEFSQMVYEDVQWENALRHVLGIAFAKDDELLAELMDENYSLAFHDGIMFGIEQAQKEIGQLAQNMSEKILSDEAKLVMMFEEDDFTEEVQDDIQAIIKKSQE